MGGANKAKKITLVLKNAKNNNACSAGYTWEQNLLGLFMVAQLTGFMERFNKKS